MIAKRNIKTTQIDRIRSKRDGGVSCELGLKVNGCEKSRSRKKGISRRHWKCRSGERKKLWFTMRRIRSTLGAHGRNFLNPTRPVKNHCQWSQSKFLQGFFTRLSSSSWDGKSKTFIFTTLFWLLSNNLISVNRHQTEATVFSLIMSFRVLSGLRPTAEDGNVLLWGLNLIYLWCSATDRPT